MDKAEVMEKIVELVSEQLEVSKEKILAESHFLNDLQADSLDIVDLMMQIEEVFDVQIEDEDQEKIETVGNAVDYIVGKLETAESKKD